MTVTGPYAIGIVKVYGIIRTIKYKGYIWDLTDL
jgi:hypothetical protein